MGKGYSCFSPHQASAHNGYFLSKLFRMEFCFNCHDYIAAIHPFYRRFQFIGTNGHKKGIRRHYLYIIRSHFGIQHNFYTGCLHPGLQDMAEFFNVLFKEWRCSRMQVPAQASCLLYQCYHMSPPSCRNCCFHSRRTPARYQHPFFLSWPRQGEFAGQLLPHGGIYRTFDCLAFTCLTKTFVASQTGRDIFFIAFQRFLWQIRVSQKGAADFHNICLAGSNDFLHLSRVIQGTNTGNRLFHMLLDFRGQIYIDPSGIKCRWMGPAEHGRILMVPTGNIKQIHLGFHHTCHLNILLQADA